MQSKKRPPADLLPQMIEGVDSSCSTLCRCVFVAGTDYFIHRQKHLNLAKDYQVQLLPRQRTGLIPLRQIEVSVKLSRALGDNHSPGLKTGLTAQLR